MELTTALWHVLNLFAVPVAFGMLAPALAKLVWRDGLRRVSWAVLARGCVAASVAVTVGALLVTGRDGMMAGYGAMVAVTALLLWRRAEPA